MTSTIPDKLTSLRQSLLKLRINAITNSSNDQPSTLSVEPLNDEILFILHELDLFNEQEQYLLANVPTMATSTTREEKSVASRQHREEMKKWFEHSVTLIATLRKKWREVSDEGVKGATRSVTAESSHRSGRSPGGSVHSNNDRKRRLSESSITTSSRHSVFAEQQHSPEDNTSTSSRPQQSMHSSSSLVHSHHSPTHRLSSSNHSSYVDSQHSSHSSPEKFHHSLLKVGEAIVRSPRLDKVVDSLTRMQLNMEEDKEDAFSADDDHQAFHGTSHTAKPPSPTPANISFEQSEYTQPLQRHTSQHDPPQAFSSRHISPAHTALPNRAPPQTSSHLDSYRTQIINETTNLLDLRFIRDRLTEQLLQQHSLHEFDHFISEKQAEYTSELDQIVASAQQLFGQVQHLEHDLSSTLYSRNKPSNPSPISNSPHHPSHQSPQQQEQNERKDMEQMYSNLSNSLTKKHPSSQKKSPNQNRSPLAYSGKNDDSNSSISGSESSVDPEVESEHDEISSYHSEEHIYMTNDGSGFTQNISTHSNSPSSHSRPKSEGKPERNTDFTRNTTDMPNDASNVSRPHNSAAPPTQSVESIPHTQQRGAQQSNEISPHQNKHSTSLSSSVNLEDMSPDERLEYFRRQEFDLLLQRMNSEGIEAPLPAISPSIALPPQFNSTSVDQYSGHPSPMDKVMELEAQWQEQKSQQMSTRRETSRVAGSRKAASQQMSTQAQNVQSPSSFASPASARDTYDSHESRTSHSSYSEVDNIYDYQAEFQSTEEVLNPFPIARAVDQLQQQTPHRQPRHTRQGGHNQVEQIESDLPSPVQPAMHQSLHRVYVDEYEQQDEFSVEYEEKSPPQRKRASTNLYGVSNPSQKRPASATSSSHSSAPKRRSPKDSSKKTAPAATPSHKQTANPSSAVPTHNKRPTTTATGGARRSLSVNRSKTRDSLASTIGSRSARTSNSSASRASVSPNRSKRKHVSPEEGRKLAQKRAAKLLREKKKQEELKKLEEITKREKVLEMQEKARKRAELAARLADEKKAMIDIMEDLSDDEDHEVDQEIEQDQEDIVQREEKVREAQRKAKKRARLAKKKLDDVRMQKEIEKAKRDKEKWKKRDQHLKEWAEERKKREEMKRKWEQQQQQNKIKQKMAVDEAEERHEENHSDKNGRADRTQTSQRDSRESSVPEQRSTSPHATEPSEHAREERKTPVKQSMRNRPVPTSHPAPQPPPRQPQRQQNPGSKKTTASQRTSKSPQKRGEGGAQRLSSKPWKDLSKKVKAVKKDEVQVFYKPNNGASTPKQRNGRMSTDQPSDSRPQNDQASTQRRILKSPIITTKTPPHYKKLLDEESNDSIAFSPFPQQEAQQNGGGPSKQVQKAGRVKHEFGTTKASSHLASLDSPLNDPSINFYEDAVNDTDSEISSTGIGDALDLDGSSLMDADLELVSDVAVATRVSSSSGGGVNRFGWKG